MNYRWLNSQLSLASVLSLALAGCSGSGTSRPSDVSPATGDGDGDGDGHGDGDASSDAGDAPPDDQPGDGDGDATGLDSGTVARGDGGAVVDPAGDGGSSGPLDAGNGDGDGDGERDSGVIEPPPPPAKACNGHPELCTRRFDEVIYPCTHNAHSAEAYGFSALNRNQKSGFDKQLADGILVDVYDKSGDHMFCHNPDLCFLGSLGHKEGLDIIKTFLDQNPREVLTLIYENGMSGDAIAEDMEAVGLDDLAYRHNAAQGWPTLGEMIDIDQRLVVTIQDGSSSRNWVKNVWDVAWDTPYTFFASSDFSCNQNRGSRDNALFLLNHWLNSKVPILNIETPDEGKADQANAFDMLYGRATRCRQESGKLPNFVAVDFYDHGDLFAVVKRLNGF